MNILERFFKYFVMYSTSVGARADARVELRVSSIFFQMNLQFVMHDST